MAIWPACSGRVLLPPVNRATHYRSHSCGELRAAQAGLEVTLAGWVRRVRKMGVLVFVDLADREGLTQVVFDETVHRELWEAAQELGREFVVQIEGQVRLREAPNPSLPTGEVEVLARSLRIFNASEVPPFKIEDATDGGEELLMRYRYLDLRRPTNQKRLMLRHAVATAVRHYLNAQGFLEIETPFLIKSTPEGARDFVVPSRLHPGHFYALPQSPQTFKQLLMVSGLDRYYQIVRCFRDEDLRADRQPEFTQIDCEMSFVNREDILQMFEGLVRHVFREIKGQDPGPLERITYEQAMRLYGSDKPDLRFGMAIVELKTKDGPDAFAEAGFQVADKAEYIGALCVGGGASFTRRQLDELTDFVKRPQIGASGLMWCRWNPDGSTASSVDKFYDDHRRRQWLERAGGRPGDILLILAGPEAKTRKQLGELRLELARRLNLCAPDTFRCLWVTDFPLLEWDEESARWVAMHHPFTAPLPEDLSLLEKHPGQVRANAYDMVINGTEVGGGSIRIHEAGLQQTLFRLLGFSDAEAWNRFGFLMQAFRFGAPPHGGIAFGFDRLVALLAGTESIRDVIAFPKNNAGRDVMIDAPDRIEEAQWKELHIRPNFPEHHEIP
ncbi:MAG: aspartate--tRNA ligase [Flavobacteriales bacterium]|nr:aspartate--tRNA ligase [Flavobacteriales bacterium]MDW8432845.1 aspartate--tRNA ligase [Flavobacteriales bacterium]